MSTDAPLDNETAHPQRVEFHRPVKVADLTDGDNVFDIEASQGELEALQARLGTGALEFMRAQATLRLLPDGDVSMTMHATARLEQTCVVTLEPMVSEISSTFTIVYSDIPDLEDDGEGEEFEDPDDETEPPDPIVEGQIDIGEACVEQLALEIDPFPRVKGATFNGYSTGPADLQDGGEERENPFHVLSKLKTHQEKPE